MTPSQAQLRAYLLSKLAESTAAGHASPGDIAKNAATTIAADVPQVLGSLLDLVSDPAIKAMGQALFSKAGAVARDLSVRGIPVVLKEVRDKARRVKTDLDMQYQRGLERQRRRR